MALTSSEPLVVSVHLPKTAGLAFREVLEDLFGAGFLYLGPSVVRQLRRDPDRLSSLLEPHHRCVHGHLDPRMFLERFPDCELVAWVRDPVERVVSQYQYWRRAPPPSQKNPWVFADVPSLLEFAERPEARNRQAEMLRGVDLDRMTFVGLQEHFEQHVQDFLLRFGRQEAGVPRLNSNPARRIGNRYRLAPGLREILRQWNAEDQELYDRAREAIRAEGRLPVEVEAVGS